MYITTNTTEGTIAYNRAQAAIEQCIAECGDKPMTASDLAIKIMGIMFQHGYQFVGPDKVVIDLSEYHRLLSQPKPYDPWGPNIIYCNDNDSAVAVCNDGVYTVTQSVAINPNGKKNIIVE